MKDNFLRNLLIFIIVMVMVLVAAFSMGYLGGYYRGKIELTSTGNYSLILLNSPRSYMDINKLPYLDYDNLGSHSQGTVSELYAAIDLLKRGFNVSRLLTISKPYDLMAEKEGVTYKVEVKTTKHRANNIDVVFVAPNSGGFDILALVTSDGKVVYKTLEEAAKRFMP